MEQEIFNILARMHNKRLTIDEANEQLLRLFSVSNSNFLLKFDKQLDKLQKIHGKVIKTYDMHSACNGYKFEDGATYRIRLDKATGQAIHLRGVVGSALDTEFLQALNDLIDRKIGNEPTKERF